jgi:predicted Fe-Mo cluster-binding NifX family protein
MKIAVSAAGRDPALAVEPRFGRAPLFLLYDTDAGAWEVLDNHANLEAAQGAGIQAAQTIVRSGAGAVLTGHCGPKAHNVLTAAGVAIYTGAEGSVESAVQLYRSGALKPSAGPDVQGHW